MKSLPANGLQSDFTMKVLHKSLRFYLVLAIFIFVLSCYSSCSTYLLQFLSTNWIDYISFTAYKNTFQNIFTTTLKLLTGHTSYRNRILRYVTYTSCQLNSLRRRGGEDVNMLKLSFGDFDHKVTLAGLSPPLLYISLWAHRFTSVSTQHVELTYFLNKLVFI